MKMPTTLLIPLAISICCTIFFISCNNESKTFLEEDDFPSLSTDSVKEIAQVEVATVNETVFYREIMSNGKLYAKTKAEVRLPLAEVIDAIYVQEGDKVQKSQLLARLNTLDMEQKIRRSREALDKAYIDLDDRLIDYGYRLKDTASVPKDILKMAKVKCGFITAQYDFENLQHELEKTRIIAPISGIISDMEARPYNRADNYRKLCAVMDNSEMDIQFSLLEQELKYIRKGTPLVVNAVTNDSVSYKGVITSINPVVDASGMITVKGRISGGNLPDGISAKVMIRIDEGKKLVIPKSALLQRQNKWVVFTFEDNKAIWNYVEPGDQNSASVVIRSGLTSGQKVIISNNIDLAHQASIKVITR